jgi:hypothetical protein
MSGRMVLDNGNKKARTDGIVNDKALELSIGVRVDLGRVRHDWRRKNTRV